VKDLPALKDVSNQQSGTPSHLVSNFQRLPLNKTNTPITIHNLAVSKNAFGYMYMHIVFVFHGISISTSLMPEFCLPAKIYRFVVSSFPFLHILIIIHYTYISVPPPVRHMILMPISCQPQSSTQCTGNPTLCWHPNVKYSYVYRPS
jgi:hypothetical protein